MGKREASPKYFFPLRLDELYSSAVKQFFKPTPETLLDQQIIVIDHFLSDDLCDELVQSFHSVKLETTPKIRSKLYSPRVNDRVSLVDYTATEALWKYFQYLVLNPSGIEDDDLKLVSEVFSNARSLNPQLRVYRYTAGHFFGKHYDESVECALASDPTQKCRTKWTLLIYLSGGDDLKGGDTIFYPEGRGTAPIRVHPQKGSALLHKHGDDCLKHEGELVKAGVKWILRSDVAF